MKTKKEFLLCFRDFTLIFKTKKDLSFFEWVLEDTLKSNLPPDDVSSECWRNIITDIIATKFNIKRV